MRPIPERAVSFIVRHESLRLVAYDDLNPNRRSFASAADVRGVPTIAYGHTRTVTAQDVVDRKRITEAMARILLKEDLTDAARRLARVVQPDVIQSLTENQYSALLSFVFNLGANPTWTLWKRLNARQYDQVPAQLARFVNATVDGKLKKMEGLVNRRNAEIALWSQHEPGSRPLALASSVTRSADTPPTPAKVSGARADMITGVTQVAGGVAAGTAAIQAAIEPASWYVTHLQTIVAVLAVVGALCGVAVLVLGWMKKREAAR